MNTAAFTGRIGNDAELKTHQDNQFCEFSIANEIGFGQNKQTQWIRCTLWGKRATTLVQYLKKGTQVAVTGSVRCRAWANPQNQPQAELQVRLNDVTLLGSPNQGSQGGGGGVPADTPF